MANTQPNIFIPQFSEEIHQVFQQSNTKLRSSVRQANGVIGSTYGFPILGKGTAAQKPRNGNLVPFEGDHSRVVATLADWYSTEYLDDLDEIKTNVALRQEYVTQVTSTINRKLDEIIITAALAGSNVTGTTAGGWTYAKHLEAFTLLNAADVDEADRFMVIGSKALSEMMNEVKVISADYTAGLLPAVSGEIGKFMGFNVIVSNLLPTATSVQTALYFNKRAIGLAIGQEPKVAVERVVQMDAWQVMAKISAGAVIIDPTGVIEMPCAV